MSTPFRLRVESGPNAGQLFPIESAGATIGRQSGNTIVLDDARLSRQHLRLDLRDGGVVVTDLGSANGTRLNGVLVSGTQPLRPGDRLQLGDTTLTLEGSAAAPALFGAMPAHNDAATEMANLPTGPVGGGAASATPRLVVQGGAEAGRVYPLDRATLTIGRQEGNDIVLDDSQASRQHARIEPRGGWAVLTDLGSANGVRVNGQRIVGSQQLHPGDTMQVGMTTFRFESGAGAPLAGAVAGGGVALAGGAPPLNYAPVPTRPLDQAGRTPAWSAAAPVIGPIPAPPPASPHRKSSSLPLILAGGLAALLLFCVLGGAGLFVVLRTKDDADPTPVATTGAAGPNPTVAVTTASTTTAQTSQTTAGSSAVAALPGSAGGNVAPPPPGAAQPTQPPQPTAQQTTTRAIQTTTTTRTVRTTTRAARQTTSRPSSGGDVFINSDYGVLFAVPAGWTKKDEREGVVIYASADGRALFVAQFGAAGAGVTPTQVIERELQATQSSDPSFNASAIQVNANIQVGGLPGAASGRYTYTNQSGSKVSEADFATVVPGQARYLFSCVAASNNFDAFTDDFTTILNGILITGP